MAYQLPALGYSYDALEPYIDAETMRLPVDTKFSLLEKRMKARAHRTGALQSRVRERQVEGRVGKRARGRPGRGDRDLAIDDVDGADAVESTADRNERIATRR